MLGRELSLGYSPMVEDSVDKTARPSPIQALKNVVRTIRPFFTFLSRKCGLGGYNLRVWNICHTPVSLSGNGRRWLFPGWDNVGLSGKMAPFGFIS